VRASELYPFGVHPEDLSKAASQGLLVKIGRGLYTRKDFPSNFEHPLQTFCEKVSLKRNAANKDFATSLKSAGFGSWCTRHIPRRIHRYRHRGEGSTS
jgi:hypothetical protein